MDVTMNKRDATLSPESFLPLRPIEFQILLSLSGGERHGYGILRAAEERTGETVRWGVGTLYRALRRLTEQGLIEATDRRPAPEEDDERRNYYRITGLGERVVTAEAQRMETLVRAAQSTGVLGPLRSAR
jgi:DNA-binding PadR family transcriptional regulator